MLVLSIRIALKTTEPTTPLVEVSQCRTYIEENLGPAYLAVRIVHRIAKAPVSQLFTPSCVAHERRDYYPCVSHDAFHLTLQGLRLVRFTQYFLSLFMP